MKTIYKYRIEKTYKSLLGIPVESKPLCAQKKDGDWYMWVLIDTGNTKLKLIEIYTIPTGHIMPEEDLTYIGSIQEEGSLIFHIFYRQKNGIEKQ
jgi:hypothetical protein